MRGQRVIHVLKQLCDLWLHLFLSLAECSQNISTGRLHELLQAPITFTRPSHRNEGLFIFVAPQLLGLEKVAQSADWIVVCEHSDLR